jgi:hypothetical protein
VNLALARTGLRIAVKVPQEGVIEAERTQARLLENGLNKSILDFFRRVESGTCPDSTLAKQRLESLFAAVHPCTARNSELVQSFLNGSITFAARIGVRSLTRSSKRPSRGDVVKEKRHAGMESSFALKRELNDDQRFTLAELEAFGWELKFVRSCSIRSGGISR